MKLVVPSIGSTDFLAENIVGGKFVGEAQANQFLDILVDLGDRIAEEIDRRRVLSSFCSHLCRVDGFIADADTAAQRLYDLGTGKLGKIDRGLFYLAQFVGREAGNFQNGIGHRIGIALWRFDDLEAHAVTVELIPNKLTAGSGFSAC